MVRSCTGKDPNLIKHTVRGEEPCDCGATFDDVDWSVIYPHQEVMGYRTLMPHFPAWEVPWSERVSPVTEATVIPWKTDTVTITRVVSYNSFKEPWKAMFLPDVSWKWLKWTFGFWIDPKNHTIFGIDFGPLEIVWHSEGYRP